MVSDYSPHRKRATAAGHATFFVRASFVGRHICLGTVGELAKLVSVPLCDYRAAVTRLPARNPARTTTVVLAVTRAHAPLLPLAHKTL